MNVDEVKNLLAAGLTYRQIGEAHGTTRNTVATFVRRRIHGLPWEYVGTVDEYRKGLPSKEKRKLPPRQKPSMPYVPGVTEDGKRYVPGAHEEC